jgi:hypothetical protein
MDTFDALYNSFVSMDSGAVRVLPVGKWFGARELLGVE